MSDPKAAPADLSEAQIEARRKELVEAIAAKEVALQDLKLALLDIQNKQNSAAIERHRTAAAAAAKK